MTNGPIVHAQPARSWAWALFPRALRSRWSWGIGDLRDLAAGARWARHTGATYLFTGPISATGACSPLDPSPYAPSSRLFLDVALLHVPWIEEWNALPSASRRRPLDRAVDLESSPLVDLDAVLALKVEVLHQLFDIFCAHPAPPEFTTYCRRMGEPLHLFALHRVAETRFGPAWPEWPQDVRTPAAAIKSDFARQNRGDIAFHAWCQWQLDRQLARAAAWGVGLARDLPVASPLMSADGWMWQELIDRDHELGAPGDYFNADGHRWGLAPFDAMALQGVSYEPIRRLIRLSTRHATGLKIDHALGLLRQYWLPRQSPVSQGRYVGQPTTDLVDVLVSEANRAGVFVVTEELGTPPPIGVGPLRGRGLLRLVVVMSEEYHDPGPEDAVMATTHDLPTVAGSWTGEGEAILRAAGIPIDPDLAERRRSRLAACARMPRGTLVDDLIPALYAELARSSSRLLIVPVDDALALPQQFNVPGVSSTTLPNFRRRLPDLEDIAASPRILRVVTAIAASR